MNKTKKDRITASVGTLLVHALVLLVLFLMAFRTPLPLPGEEGVEVDLGMMNVGMGNVQPDKPTIPQITPPQPKQEDTEEEYLTENNEETPAIEKPKPVKPKEEQPKEEQPKEPEQPKVNDKALFKGSKTTPTEGSEGTTGQPGDQGNPNGLAGVKKYDGQGGKGNGPGYDLGGRGAKSLQRPPDDFPEEGKIVVEIWVDQEGNVVRTNIAKGTEVVDSEMRRKAEEAARRSKFAPDPTAPKEQKGTITYFFVKNQ